MLFRSVIPSPTFSLSEPYRLIHETQKITQTEGWTWYDQKDLKNHSLDPNEREKVKRSRIDYIFVSEALVDFIIRAWISNPPFTGGTDHRIVNINIEFNSFIRGVGYYRCPPDLLDDEIFKGVLKTSVCSIIAKNTKGPFYEDKIGRAHV